MELSFGPEFIRLCHTHCGETLSSARYSAWQRPRVRVNWSRFPADFVAWRI